MNSPMAPPRSRTGPGRDGGRARPGLLVGLALLPGFVLAALWLVQMWNHHGVTAAYYRNSHHAGEPFAELHERSMSLATLRERSLTFPQQDFSILWDGWLRVPERGSYCFTLRSRGNASLNLDGRGVLTLPPGEAVAYGDILLDRGLHALMTSTSHRDGLYAFEVRWCPSGGEPREILSPSLYVAPPHPLLLWAETRGLRLYVITLLLAGLALLLVQTVRLRRRRRMGAALRALLPRLAALTAATLLALVAAEICARMYLRARQTAPPLEQQLERSEGMTLEERSGPYYSLAGLVRPSRDPGRIYELKPGLTGMFVDRPVRINSLGMRDREYSLEKPEGTFRILGLGDSVMFGWGVREEDSYLGLLEERYARRGSAMPVEILNMGIPGYNTAMEAAQLDRRGAELDPDLVLVGFIGNDLNLPNFMVRQDRNRAHGSILLGSITGWWDGLLGRQDPGFLALDLDDRFHATPEEVEADESVPPELRSMVGVPGFRLALGRIARLAEAEGFRLAMAGWGGPDPVDLAISECEAHGIPFLDLGEARDRYIRTQGLTDAGGFQVSPEDSHPNEAGHRVIADVLEDWLEAEGLVPP